MPGNYTVEFIIYLVSSASRPEMAAAGNRRSAHAGGDASVSVWAALSIAVECRAAWIWRTRMLVGVGAGTPRGRAGPVAPPRGQAYPFADVFPPFFL